MGRLSQILCLGLMSSKKEAKESVRRDQRYHRSRGTEKCDGATPTAFSVEERGQEPKTVSSPWTPEKARRWILPHRASREKNSFVDTFALA